MAMTDIKAPAAVAWECIADLEAAPRIIGMVVSMERCSTHEKSKENDCEKKFAVGTRWKETRVYRGKELQQQKVITTLSECRDPASYSVCIAVTFPTGMLVSVANTCTLTVTSLSETTSQLMGTFAIRYGICTKLFLFLICGPCRTRDAKLAFQTEMDEYGAEAEKRYQATLTSKVQSK
jgi:hypothetical protein